ncbi:hypothetical protein Desdi_1374 [Desulfitobacterium dichloroeliminans LMG P-21439]|uniref:Uncharacterized protein n=1 Tax=Desulfitobacterium dichloroeliminans (strain LMG P-21439 / DCA1) TaxID=871963 RepID=L0F4W6_DESDL|nr:hypothetical protein Desdi_1374 [Desulfitobacterium dichloroeliminans LMG P-21439]
MIYLSIIATIVSFFAFLGLVFTMILGTSLWGIKKVYKSFN